MNFFFMLLIIFIILIFMKLKIKVIPNYAMLLTTLGLLIINELYYLKFTKESFNPYIYDGTYDKYFERESYLHMSDNHIDNIGLMCSLNKNVSIKNIQDTKFKEYKDFKEEINNVIYGNKQIDDVKMPDNFGNITQENEEIQKVNDIICPPVCHLINNESDCNNAVDYKEVLNNENEILTTRPVFNNKRMMRHAYECIKSNPCDTSNGCREVNGLCVYDKKKCVFENNKCRQKCEIYETQTLCPKDKCNWNNNNLKCEEKN